MTSTLRADNTQLERRFKDTRESDDAQIAALGIELQRERRSNKSN